LVFATREGGVVYKGQVFRQAHKRRKVGEKTIITKNLKCRQEAQPGTPISKKQLWGSPSAVVVGGFQRGLRKSQKMGRKKRKVFVFFGEA